MSLTSLSRANSTASTRWVRYSTSPGIVWISAPRLGRDSWISWHHLICWWMKVSRWAMTVWRSSCSSEKRVVGLILVRSILTPGTTCCCCVCMEGPNRDEVCCCGWDKRLPPNSDDVGWVVVVVVVAPPKREGFCCCCCCCCVVVVPKRGAVLTDVLCCCPPRLPNKPLPGFCCD